MSTVRRDNPLITTPGRPLPKRVAIIGAGTIGPDIGYYLLSSIPGLQLTLVDVAQDALDRAEARLNGYIAKGLKRRRLTEAQAEQVRSGLRTTLDYDAISDAEWVLEAATEDLPLKRKIFAAVEARVSDSTIITSNTSSLPAARIFSELKNKSRATVTHFFAPAFRNPAVEVIRYEACDDEVIEYLRWVFAATGKVPLETSDALCFMLDRIFDNWCNEAAYLLEHATASEVDSVAADYVHAGPFFVLNMA
ncbi:MAG TPA: 3-hydroxyacyl-CoA dehydrogenase family protein, partial [Polyangiaceae bacterium]|nr:3-hydroxyacyl-CoA dehydrogenase family protein [Polyangiaceae bacterium]